MRFALLSDIHGNLEALEVILKRIEPEKVDEIFCLGDIVGYGANPNECVALIREVSSACVLGNHDSALIGHTSPENFNGYAKSAIDWTLRVIKKENLDYLRSLPLTYSDSSMLLVHSTPVDPASWNYILSQDQAEEQFEGLNGNRIAFIGHSHIPVKFSDKFSSKQIINVGSVGQPRDRDPRACCGIYDSEAGTFEWLREVYSVQDTAQKIRDAGLPEFLAMRLFIGM